MVSTEVVAYVVPLTAILIACDCHDGELIGPETPLIVAEAFVKVTEPKLATVAILPPTLGASTIHSAEVRWARGLCVADELSYVLKESFVPAIVDDRQVELTCVGTAGEILYRCRDRIAWLDRHAGDELFWLANSRSNTSPTRRRRRSYR